MAMRRGHAPSHNDQSSGPPFFEVDGDAFNYAVGRSIHDASIDDFHARGERLRPNVLIVSGRINEGRRHTNRKHRRHQPGCDSPSGVLLTDEKEQEDGESKIYRRLRKIDAPYGKAAGMKMRV